MIVTVDQNGEIVSTNESSAYPAPREMVERIAQHYPPESGMRVLEIPPFSPAYWHFPDGAGEPVMKPAIGAAVTKLQVVADETDATVVTDLPPGALVEVHGPEGVHAETADEGGRLAVSFATPGTHQIRVHAAGRRGTRMQVEAVARPEDHRPKRPGLARRSRGMLAGAPLAEWAGAVVFEIDAQADRASAETRNALAMMTEVEKVERGEESARLDALAKASGVSTDAVVSSLRAQEQAFWDSQERRGLAKAAIAQAIERGAARDEIRGIARGAGFEIADAGAEGFFG